MGERARREEKITCKGGKAAALYPLPTPSLRLATGQKSEREREGNTHGSGRQGRSEIL